jgi:hypothetical protein
LPASLLRLRGSITVLADRRRSAVGPWWLAGVWVDEVEQ